MLPKWHIFLTAAFCAVLYLLGFDISLQNILLIILGGILIDIDHYIAYIFIKKDFNLKRAYKYFVKMREKIKRGKKVNVPLCVFHTLEFVIALAVIVFFNKTLLFLFIAMLFHLMLDFIEGFLTNTTQFSKYSIIYSVSRRK